MLRRLSPLSFLATLVALCACLVSLSYMARRRGGISMPESVSFQVLRLVQRPLAGLGGWAADIARVATHRSSLIAQNRLLLQRLQETQAQNERLMMLRRDNDQLRGLLKMPAPEAGRFVAADVVSVDATDYARRMILNAGSRQGVRVKDAVFTSQGVVGQVIAVAPLSCVVMLLTDRLSGVGAMTDRAGVKSVVLGTGEKLCKMAYLDYQADVREGDNVVTSGDSNLFPKGYPIGRVLAVSKNKIYSEMTAEVQLAVPFDQLSVVNVRVQAGP